MRVWRVEDEAGRGPYESVTKEEISLSSAHADDGHPCPQEDGLRAVIWGEVYPFSEYLADDRVHGMDSLAGLMGWFDGWWEVLEQSGFSAYEYEVPDDHAAVGRSGQVVFIKSVATQVA